MITLLSFLLLANAGCGAGTQSVTTTDGETACVAGQAQVGVFDSFTKVLCGCTEAAGTTVISPATLNCTVPAGTQVVFQYLATTLKHQIVPTGTVSVFTASPLSDPSQHQFVVHSHAILLTTAGDYSFQDAFNNALSGVLHVQ